MAVTGHPDLYRLAEFYEIAFDFRDVPAECDFLAELVRRHLGRTPESFLELAAGPAFHTLEFARRGSRAVALDLAPAMIERALAKARAENLEVEYVQGDMTDFDLGSGFDLVAILMDSTSYLLDNAAVLANLDRVADHLNDGGIYVLEMGHPRGVFGEAEHVGSDWEMEREGTRVKMRWGEKTDDFDPITQITDTTVTLEYHDGEDSGAIVARSRQRCFGPNELKALVAASGRFSIVETFGSMSADVPFDNREEAWRMVPVLQKTA